MAAISAARVIGKRMYSPIFLAREARLDGVYERPYQSRHGKYIAVLGVVNQKQPVIAAKLASKITQCLHGGVIFGRQESMLVSSSNFAALTPIKMVPVSEAITMIYL